MFSTQFTYTYFTNSLVSIKKFSGRVGFEIFLKSRVGSGLKIVRFHLVGFGNQFSRVGSGSKITLPAHLYPRAGASTNFPQNFLFIVKLITTSNLTKVELKLRFLIKLISAESRIAIRN